MTTEIIQTEDIKSKIFTLRSVQVMLDSDLAMFYGLETKYLNRAVKRNIERFPRNYMFQLTENEFSDLRFQFGTSRKNYGGRRFLPYVFSEHGIAMLSAVLHSEMAVQVSIQIIDAFVIMRHYLKNQGGIFQRIENLELKQLQTEIKIDGILNVINTNDLVQEQGIFFNGQIFDAYKFISDLVRSAKISLYLIDNYIDDSVLTLFSKREKGVKVKFFTKAITENLKLDVTKFSKQYEPIEIVEFNLSHDRFLIIDEKELYHIGASLKDLGKKWFAFSKMDIDLLNILERIKC
jgi:hypothetical protein